MKLRALITEDASDNVLEPLRIAFLIAFAISQGLTIYTVVGLGQPFDIQAYGIGIGSLLATTGAALWASSHQKDE